MKLKIFTLLLILATGLISCRKDQNDPTIKQYDNQQILAYIAKNNIKGMIRDTAGGDTTGIYYEIIKPGTGSAMQYSDLVSFVFSMSSFDGKYASLDTINNHFYDYLGHVNGTTVTNTLPLTNGLQLALKNDLKNFGGIMRVLIPSHLAYGINGNGTGSVTNSNTRVYGNQCLDFYVHVMGNTANDNQATYDDQVIQNYMKNNSLTGYTKTQSTTLPGSNPGNFYYFKVLTAATGSDQINDNSTITADYTAQLFNAFIIQDENLGVASDPTLNAVDLTYAAKEALENNASVGTKISIITPSTLAYGTAVQTTIPANSCVRFTFTVLAITP